MPGQPGSHLGRALNMNVEFKDYQKDIIIKSIQMPCKGSQTQCIHILDSCTENTAKLQELVSRCLQKMLDKVSDKETWPATFVLVYTFTGTSRAGPLY